MKRFVGSFFVLSSAPQSSRCGAAPQLRRRTPLSRFPAREDRLCPASSHTGESSRSSLPLEMPHIMSWRFVLTIVGLILAAASALGSKPNIVVILADDAGYADFGFTDGALVPTPHLDRLAASGIICHQGYVTASTCTPSRMGLISGRYQQKFGAECNVPIHPTPGYTEEDLGLDTQEQTLGDVMQKQGYRTIAIGKWHLGELPQYYPMNRGFDEFYGFLGGSRTYWPSDKQSFDKKMRRDWSAIDESEEISYLTDDLTDAALAFIDRNQETPFFIYLAYNAVHGPFEAKEADLARSPDLQSKNRRLAAAMTISLDENVGRLRSQLESLGLLENTLIVFLNDNGGTPGGAHSNGELRGHKGSYWEGGIRVPFVVSWPARLPMGQSFMHPVSSLDLMPTFVSASGGSLNAFAEMDGVNLLPYLRGERKGVPHEAMFWRFWRVAVAREGPWKLIRVAEDPLQESRALLSPLILINLENDPGETTNLAAKFPEKARELVKRLQAWETELSQPRWYDGRDWQHWQEEQVKNHRMMD